MQNRHIINPQKKNQKKGKLKQIKAKEKNKKKAKALTFTI